MFGALDKKVSKMPRISPLSHVVLNQQPAHFLVYFVIISLADLNLTSWNAIVIHALTGVYRDKHIFN